MSDFRSDTLTRPTPAMRRAMAEAVVGDDVWGEDPTVRDLQEEVAHLFGREASLFVPSGCQGNQIAAWLHTSPGEEVALGDACHGFDWELAGLAALSGLQARPIRSERGCLDLEQVAATLRPAGGFKPACRLLLVENTHNFHGGAVVPLSHLAELWSLAQSKGAKVHLDGARLWNAAEASGTPLDAYGELADTIMVCLSKGLGAPVGSLLIGDQETMVEAREVRKLLGGGMRQVGVLAAPGRVALHEGRARLGEDHARAKRLAAGLRAVEGVSLPHGEVETNIVIVEKEGMDAAEVCDRMAAQDLLAAPAGAQSIRFVTYSGVDDRDVDRAIEVFRDLLA